jgi:hypothetical protein
MLSFLWHGNNASTKEKAPSTDLPRTYGMLGRYRALTPSFVLSYLSLQDVHVYNAIKYNNIGKKPLSS